MKGIRTVSSDSRNIGQNIDILKEGIQFFTKNIVIEPVFPQYKSGQKSTYSFENMTSVQRISSVKKEKDGKTMKIQGTKRAWEIEGRSGDDVFYGRTPSDQEKLSDSALKSRGIDDKTKYYSKQIVVQPVNITKKNSKQ